MAYIQRELQPQILSETPPKAIVIVGYVLSDATVRLVAYWREQDATEDIMILLLDLVFSRCNQNEKKKTRDIVCDIASLKSWVKSD